VIALFGPGENSPTIIPMSRALGRSRVSALFAEELRKVSGRKTVM